MPVSHYASIAKTTLFLHLDQLSDLVASVGIQTAVPALVGMMWDVDCYQGNSWETTFTVTFEPGTHYYNGPGSGHPGERPPWNEEEKPFLVCGYQLAA